MRRNFVGWVVAASVIGLALGCGKDDDSADGPVTVTACGFDGVESAIAAAKGKVVLEGWA